MNKIEANNELQFLDYPSATAASSGLTNSSEGSELLDAYSQAVTGVVTGIGPAVVNVHMRRKTHPRPGMAPHEAEGTASGVIIAPDG